MATLRLVCVNDVYSLENLPRLRSLVVHHATSAPADTFMVTLAGDFVGPSLLASLDQGRGMVDCMNRVGITHAILGNHEDDLPTSELRARIAELRATWIASNVHGLDPRLLERATIAVGGIKVGLVGVVTVDRALYRREPPFGAPVEPAVAAARRETARLLGAEGCAAVIALTHQSIGDDRELARWAQRAGAALPLIVGGHEHTVVHEQVGETWIVKAGSEAAHAAVVELAWTPGAARPAVTVHIEDVAGYPEDPSLRARVDGHLRRVRELEAATLLALAPGETLSSVGARARQTSLGTLFCSRLRDTLEAEACLMNGGGIRGGREYRDRFTYGDLKAEVPFDNDVVVALLPGRVIAAAVAASRSHAPAESGGFLQVDDRMAVDPAGGVTAIDGAPLDPGRDYRVALVRDLMTGLDHEEPLVRFASDRPDRLPAPSGRETKLILVEAFSRALWRSLGTFAEIDADGDGRADAGEVAAAIARTTGGAPSPVLAELVVAALDRDHDRAISRDEAEPRVIDRPMRMKPCLTLEDARAVLAAARAEAVKNGWAMSIAVVDDGGLLVALERMDGAFPQSAEIAFKKAWTAAMVRLSTKTMEEMVKDRPALVAFPGQVRVQGGLPLKVGGECVGAVGVSGMASHQDEQVAAAGLAALPASV